MADSEEPGAKENTEENGDNEEDKQENVSLNANEVSEKVISNYLSSCKVLILFAYPHKMDLFFNFVIWVGYPH